MSKKKPMQFKVNGKPLATTHTPPIILRAIKYLEKLGDGELVKSAELGNLLGYHIHGFQNESRHSALQPYTAIIRFPARQKVFGNKRTIAELRKHKEVVA